MAAAQELQSLPLFIDDTPGISIAALRTRSRRLKRRQGLGLIVVDYLQLMRLPAGIKPENRVQEVSEITRGLKAIAKELNLPVLALAQLSRAVEQREDKRPQLSDLRESGSIEQDSDVVMFIYRDQYYLERSEPKQREDEANDRFAKRHDDWVQRCERAHNKAEINIAKQRHGPIGTVELRFEGVVTKFDNLVARRSPVGWLRQPRATTGPFSRSTLPPSSPIGACWLSSPAPAMAAPAVKADAYGLGMAEVAPALAAAGARSFFVATAEEGAALRRLLPARASMC